MNGHILRRDKARTFDSLIFVSTGDFYYQPECFMKLQLKPRNGLFFFALYLPSLSYFSLCLLPPFFLTLTPFFLFLSLSLRSPISPSLSYSSSSLFLGFFFFVLLCFITLTTQLTHPTVEYLLVYKTKFSLCKWKRRTPLSVK